MSLLLLWNVQDVIWQYWGAEVRGVRSMSSGVGEGGIVSVRYAYEASGRSVVLRGQSVQVV